LASNDRNSSDRASDSSNEAETGIQNTSSEDTNSPDFYIPLDTPPEVLAYGSELQQLEVGRAGKLGALTVKLEYDEDRRKTIVRDLYTKGPIHAQRALYLEESIPSMAYMYIMSTSGGILQGDRYRMDIALSKGAKVHITTQGATRIYRMERNYATQIVNVDLEADTYFEFIPDQIIPYRNSRFYQTLKMRVHDSATMVYSEMVVPGRVASGESFEYDMCYLKAIGLNQVDQLRFTDIAILEPRERNLSQMGVLSNRTVVGSVYVLCPTSAVKSIKDDLNSILSNNTEVVSGASIMPYNSGIIVRLLGDGASALRAAIFDVVRVVRKTILNAEFSGIRKG
jgi:urease accessory protein